MNMRIILTFFTSFVSVAAFALEPPAVGSAAPEFSLPDANGKTHSMRVCKRCNGDI